MKQRINIFIIFLLLCSFVPFQGVSAEEGKLTPAYPSIQIREGPGLAYPPVASGSEGDRFTEISREYGWVHVETSDGQMGWIAEWLLTEVSVAQPETEQTENPSSSAVTTDQLRVRDAPSEEGEILTVLAAGEVLQVLSEESDWSEIRTSTGVTGWVFSAYIEAQETADEDTGSESNRAYGTILVDRLNVRSDASAEGAVIGTLNSGDQVNVLDEQYGWLEVETGSISGWVSSSYVEYNLQGSNAADEIPADEPLQADIHITADGLNVRSEPDRTSESIGTVSLYESYTVLDQSGEWVLIEFREGEQGWIASWYTAPGRHAGSSSVTTGQEESITILYNGSNIRREPSTNAEIVYRAQAGEVFSALSHEGDWIEIKLADGTSGFIANWIVSSDAKPDDEADSSGVTEEPETDSEPVTSIEDATIVIDAGHGGRDGGTIGASGTLEKSITLRTAEILYHKLVSAGANVIMTRQDDRYIELHQRVAISQQHDADAFVSIHYDSVDDRSVRGYTTYFYGGPDEDLANAIHTGLEDQMTIRNRGVHFGNFLVLRDNTAPSALIELGFISNPSEEASVTNDRFREIAATGIYNGLTVYFSGDED
ncbi:SH3 domain-containing protein [Jeotgalibacillus aurantiacus]|uniref:SH3 domain-containing protein n=1 Tax=Jeotgalibacillus aurantiacus TaxID=2763266 RepID=UPI001D0AEB6F|nr:SH3 domain-containing protein [Jeotgalibacillus aurantiacus]